jgi:hypothetical protein
MRVTKVYLLSAAASVLPGTVWLKPSHPSGLTSIVGMRVRQVRRWRRLTLTC